jgi:hypothetical protein
MSLSEPKSPSPCLGHGADASAAPASGTLRGGVDAGGADGMLGAVDVLGGCGAVDVLAGGAVDVLGGCGAVDVLAGGAVDVLGG